MAESEGQVTTFALVTGWLVLGIAAVSFGLGVFLLLANAEWLVRFIKQHGGRKRDT